MIAAGTNGISKRCCTVLNLCDQRPIRGNIQRIGCAPSYSRYPAVLRWITYRLHGLTFPLEFPCRQARDRSNVKLATVNLQIRVAETVVDLTNRSKHMVFASLVDGVPAFSIQPSVSSYETLG